MCESSVFIGFSYVLCLQVVVVGSFSLYQTPLSQMFIGFGLENKKKLKSRNSGPEKLGF